MSNLLAMDGVNMSIPFGFNELENLVVMRAPSSALLPRTSEKLLQCFGGFLGTFLKHPVTGVLQHDDGCVGRNLLGLWP